jgi:hypothetical protein
MHACMRKFIKLIKIYAIRYLKPLGLSSQPLFAVTTFFYRSNGLELGTQKEIGN